MRNSTSKLICLFLAVSLFLSFYIYGSADSLLSGYQEELGYTYLFFGHYPQWIDGGIPTRMAWDWGSHRLDSFDTSSIESSPILWRILTNDGDHLYLLSEYVLLAHPLHYDYGEYSKMGQHFEQTDLCSYLNTTFLNDSFSAEEQTHILPHETYGSVYLLGLEDFKNPETGLCSGEKAKAWGTEYAIRVTGLFVYLKMRGMHSCYWLRNQSTSRLYNALCTKGDGSIGNLVADRNDEGVRPVFQLKLEGVQIVSGSGTLEDPYQISFE